MTTKHNHPVVFGRKVAGCARCEELKAGAAPVAWSHTRRDSDYQRLRDIRAHQCGPSRCGPVCTFGDY